MSRKTPYGRFASGKSQSGAMRMVPSHGMSLRTIRALRRRPLVAAAGR